MGATMLFAALLISCSQAVTAERKIEMLESQQLEILADLHRQKAECEAQAIEFAGVPGRAEVIDSCLRSYRAMVDASQTTLGNLDKAIAEIRRVQLKNNPFNQFDKR